MLTIPCIPAANCCCCCILIKQTQTNYIKVENEHQQTNLILILITNKCASLRNKTKERKRRVEHGIVTIEFGGLSVTLQVADCNNEITLRSTQMLTTLRSVFALNTLHANS